MLRKSIFISWCGVSIIVRYVYAPLFNILALSTLPAQLLPRLELAAPFLQHSLGLGAAYLREQPVPTSSLDPH